MSMHLISSILVALVAIEHSLIMVAEMWFWRTPWVMERFRPKPGTVECPAVYAANQGLYNGFLAAGLFWSILSNAHGLELKIFFLACVIVAGIYGAVTVKPQILLVQSVPAGLALATTLLGR